MFDTLIRPILTCGSDAWGLSKARLDIVDKVFLNCARCTLNVKAITCNAIVYGECGRYPLSVFCHINVLCYLHRLLTMPGQRIVKPLFHTLDTLRGHGFTTQRHTSRLRFMISIWMLVLCSQQNNLNHFALNARNLYLLKIGILNFAINLYWDRTDCTKMSSTPNVI